MPTPATTKSKCTSRINEIHPYLITDQWLYYYEVMSFGLKNVKATYKRMVNKMFAKQLRRNMEVYVDIMLVKSKKTSSHITNLTETFDILRKYKMILNPATCSFDVSSGKFFGFMVNERGIGANPKRSK